MTRAEQDEFTIKQLFHMVELLLEAFRNSSRVLEKLHGNEHTGTVEAMISHNRDIIKSYEMLLGPIREILER